MDRNQNEMSVVKNRLKQVIIAIAVVIGITIVSVIFSQVPRLKLRSENYEGIVIPRNLNTSIPISSPGTLILGSIDIDHLKDLLKKSVDVRAEEISITKKAEDFITAAKIGLGEEQKLSEILTEVSFKALKINVTKKSVIRLEKDKAYYVCWEPEPVSSKK